MDGAPTTHSACRDGTLRWQALPDWEALLFDPEGLRLDEWLKEGLVGVVKQGAHRTVYHVRLPRRAFYVKQYRRDRLVDTLGHLVRPSAARREWHKAAEVARRGIPTVKPIAWAEQVRGGMVHDNYLFTEAIEPDCSLQQYVAEELPRLPPPIRHAMRCSIIESLARFVAAIHRAGVFHGDFHVGNVLLRLDASSPGLYPGDLVPEPYLIDLPGVRFSGPLKWPASRASLIMFAAGCWERTSRSERLRFWQTYLVHRPELWVPQRRVVLEQLERGFREYSCRVARRRDKRALRTNRDYVALRTRHAVAHGVADLGLAALGRLAEDPKSLLEQNLHRPVKLSHGKVIVEADLPLDSGSVHVALARHRHRNWWKALSGRFRRGRAIRAWQNAHALLTRQIATARPIAVCRVRRRWSAPESYLATEWIDGAENLHLYGWRLAARCSTDRLRRAASCAQSLGQLIGRMHAWQISHGDLKAANLLVVERDGKPLFQKTYLIDAEDVRIARRLTRRRRVRDLARLAVGLYAHPWVTRTIICRFLRAYVRQLPAGSAAWKPLWREVARRSGRIVRGKRRRGQQIL